MIITTSQGGHFLDFCGFSWRYAGPQSNLHSRMEISSMALTTPKSPMLLRFQILCIDQLKKNSYFDRKLTKSESEATIWKFFEKWMLWVVSFLGVDAFLPIWILFALDVYCYILSSGYRNWKF